MTSDVLQSLKGENIPRDTELFYKSQDYKMMFNFFWFGVFFTSSHVMQSSTSVFNWKKIINKFFITYSNVYSIYVKILLLFKDIYTTEAERVAARVLLERQGLG